MGHALLPVAAKQLQALADANIIKRDRSFTCAPFHIVPKPLRKDPITGKWKEQSFRCTIDYRKLNKVLEDDSTPTPNIGDALGQIREIAVKSHKEDLRQGITPDREDATPDDPKQAVLSVLDLTSAFFCLPVKPGFSQKLTAFSVPGSGSWTMNSMPQGIKIGPSAWAAYAQKRLEKWQLLYEPGHELPVESGLWGAVRGSRGHAAASPPLSIITAMRASSVSSHVSRNCVKR